MSVSTWPGKSIKAMPTGTASIAIADADKIDAGDVDAIADGAVAFGDEVGHLVHGEDAP